jgi:hypothetical protein
VAPNSQNSKSRHDDPPFLHLKTTKKSSNLSLLFTINRYPISRLSGNQQPQPQPYRDRPNSAPPTTPKANRKQMQPSSSVGRSSAPVALLEPRTPKAVKYLHEICTTSCSPILPPSLFPQNPAPITRNLILMRATAYKYAIQRNGSASTNGLFTRMRGKGLRVEALLLVDDCGWSGENLGG